MTLKIPDDILDSQPGLRRRQDDQSSLTKSLGIAIAVISIVGSVFVAGYNWRSVAILEANQDQFVRKDVQQEQLRNINDRLTDISRQFQELRAELEKERGRSR